MSSAIPIFSRSGLVPKDGKLALNGRIIRHLIAAGVLAAITLIITSNAWLDIIRIAWFDEESSHVWLVPIMVFWLIWVRRERLRDVEVSGSWFGVALIAAGCLSWSLGYHFQIQILWHGGALLMFIGALLTVLGTEVAKRFLPAVLILAFLIPVPATGRVLIAVPLQRITAELTQSVAEVIGIDMQRSGSILSLNGTEVAVAEACNGMRMVFTLFLACYMAAFVTPLRNSYRILMLALAPVVAVACNVIRLIATVWVFAHFSLGQAQLFHTVTGWVMVVFAFLLLVNLAWLSQWAGIPVVKRMRAFLSTPRNIAAENEGRKEFALSICAVGLLSCAGAYRLTLPSPRDATAYQERIRQIASEMPLQIGPWTGRDVQNLADVVDILHPNIFINRHFENEVTTESASLLIVQCGDARDLAPHYPPACYPARGLTLVESRPQVWKVGGWTANGMEYEFESNAFMSDGALIVDNFILLPNGTITGDIKAIHREIGLQNRYFGAAEVQIVFGANTPAQRREQILETLVQAYRPLFDAIGAGPRD